MTHRSPSHERLAGSPPSPTLTYHPSLFSGHIPTPALLESAAGGAHYSGAKIEHDTRRLRRGSSGRRGSSVLEVKGDHKKVIQDLNELYCCRPTREILERRWRPDAIFEARSSCTFVAEFIDYFLPGSIVQMQWFRPVCGPGMSAIETGASSLTPRMTVVRDGMLIPYRERSDVNTVC